MKVTKMITLLIILTHYFLGCINRTFSIVGNLLYILTLPHSTFLMSIGILIELMLLWLSFRNKEIFLLFSWIKILLGLFFCILMLPIFIKNEHLVSLLSLVYGLSHFVFIFYYYKINSTLKVGSDEKGIWSSHILLLVESLVAGVIAPLDQ